jgi:hypothetical protein
VDSRRKTLAAGRNQCLASSSKGGLSAAGLVDDGAEIVDGDQILASISASLVLDCRSPQSHGKLFAGADAAPCVVSPHCAGPVSGSVADIEVHIAYARAETGSESFWAGARH